MQHLPSFVNNYNYTPRNFTCHQTKIYTDVKLEKAQICFATFVPYFFSISIY